VEDEHVERPLVAWRGNRQRAVMTSEERVGGGAAAVVLRTARELAQHPARRLVALGRGDPRRKVRRRPAVDRPRIRVQSDRRYDELATWMGADSGIRTRTERGRAEIVDVRGKAQSEVPEGKDRGDAETPVRSRPIPKRPGRWTTSVPVGSGTAPSSEPIAEPSDMAAE